MGVPNRWGRTVMVRGISGEEAAAKCTSVRTVYTQQLGKTTWQSIFVFIQEKNHSPVHIVLIALQPKIALSSMFAHILEKNLLPVLTALFEHHRIVMWKPTSVFILERDRIHVPSVLIGHLRNLRYSHTCWHIKHKSLVFT